MLSVFDATAALAGDPDALRSRVPAGCHPVRVVEDAARGRVWVSARESHAVLAYDLDALVDDPDDALRAVMPVPPSPVGLAVANTCGTLLVAGSNRFAPAGRGGWLSTVDRSPGGYDVASVRAGRFPRELSLADDGRVYLTAFASAAVHALRLRAPPGCEPA